MSARHFESGSNYNLSWNCVTGLITATTRLEWNFASSFDETEQAALRTRFSTAVLTKWNSHGYHLEATRSYDGLSRADANSRPAASYNDSNWDMTLDAQGLPANIFFRFDLVHTEDGEHWDVEMHAEELRSNVNSLSGNINVDPQDSNWVYQHEFGHALGLPDEYDECVHGSRTWGICDLRNLTRPSDRFSDVDGLMSVGNQLRARYFYRIRDRLNSWTNHRYMFQLRPLDANDDSSEDAVAPAEAEYDYNDDIGSAAWGGA